MREVSEKQTGSSYSADEFTNGVSQESQNFIRNTSRTLDSNDRNQMTKSALDYSTSSYYLDAGSTVDAYVVTAANSNLTGNAKYTAYRDAMIVTFFISSDIDANSGATPTLNVNNIGPRNFTLPDGSNPPPGTIIRFKTLTCIYNATADAFVLMDPVGSDLLLRLQLENTIPPLEGSRFIGHTATTVYNELNRLVGLSAYAFASVDANGTLLYSDGVTSSVRQSLGLYLVTFDNDLPEYPVISMTNVVNPNFGSETFTCQAYKASNNTLECVTKTVSQGVTPQDSPFSIVLFNSY